MTLVSELVTLVKFATEHSNLLSKQSVTVSFIIDLFTLRASGEVVDFGSSFKKQFNRDRGDCHREE